MTLEVYNQATLLKNEIDALDYVIENLDTLSPEEILTLTAKFPEVKAQDFCLHPEDVPEFRSILHDRWEECSEAFAAL